MPLTLYGLPLLDNPNDLTKEVWADAYGYSGFYVVSTMGRIASNHGRVEQIKRSWLSHGKRHVVELYRDGDGGRKISFAKLILMTFEGKPKEMSNPTPHHYNLNRHDLRLFNLTWIDQPFAKINALDAEIIRINFRAGCKIADLAEAYGLSEKHVLNILRQDHWQPPLKARA